jgi:hypothetical protein
MDPTDFAKVVPRGMRVERVFRERFLTLQEFELALVHLNHQSILATAYGAIAHGQLRKVGLDFKPHCSAMATPYVFLQRPIPDHGTTPIRSTSKYVARPPNGESARHPTSCSLQTKQLRMQTDPTALAMRGLELAPASLCRQADHPSIQLMADTAKLRNGRDHCAIGRNAMYSGRSTM